LGGGLRQLTNFEEGETSVSGCAFFGPPGCSSTIDGHNLATDTVIFDSSCNPFGSNSFGEEIFVMNFDGTGMRQLTDFRGVMFEDSGAVSVEMPGPIAYGESFQ
jgi:hypothetical protein